MLMSRLRRPKIHHIACTNRSPEQRHNDPMTRPLRLQSSLKRPTEEGEIAQHVEHLVTNRLIGRSKSTGIDDAVIAKDHCIVEATATNEAHPPHRGNVPLETECSRPGEFPGKSPGLEPERQTLLAHSRVVEVYTYIEDGMVRWDEACPARSV